MYSDPHCVQISVVTYEMHHAKLVFFVVESALKVCSEHCKQISFITYEMRHAKLVFFVGESVHKVCSEHCLLQLAPGPTGRCARNFQSRQELHQRQRIAGHAR